MEHYFVTGLLMGVGLVILVEKLRDLKRPAGAVVPKGEIQTYQVKTEVKPTLSRNLLDMLEADPIIGLLMSHGPQTGHGLARLLKLPSTTVRDRLVKLLDQGHVAFDEVEVGSRTKRVWRIP